jgi:molybdenum cofactor guanylyltransferase
MAAIMKCVGIVLAGGASRRFGSPKPLAKWQDRSFIEWAVQSLSPLTDSVIVIARGDLIEPIKKEIPSDIMVYTDIEEFKGKGPLAGIYSGMVREKAEFYMISPCDMPLMESSMYKKWLQVIEDGQYDCIIPVVRGKVFPLNGIYKGSCLPEIENCLREKKYKVLEFLNQKNTYYMEVNKEDSVYFQNVNSREDLLGLEEAKLHE